ncbi:MAG TPA: hypothetical protein DGT23_28945 [Micromonosporaceae bacterium]|nr:hypothetical protein [Micromonosporaceae bacterium]
MSQVEASILEFKDQKSFEKWLEKNFEDQTGLWLKLAKAGKGITSITYPEALDVALCFGWIDGQKKSLDDHHWLQKFTPRRKRSIWSLINTEKAMALVDSGRMRPSGQREIDLAREDGRWDAAYSGQRTAAVPAEIKALLDADPAAAAFFAGLNSTNRYAYIFRMGNAKRADTKARLVEKLREGHLFYP